MSPTLDHDLQALARRRFRVGAALSAVMVAVYFGFTLLVAFDKPLLGALAAPGLSFGIGLGACVILFAWLLTGWYVHWANDRYDVDVARLRGGSSHVG